MKLREKLSAYGRYNLLTMPIIAGLYLPYQIWFIGLSPVQFLKWISTTGIMSLLGNLILQPWVSWAYRKRWLK